jgi:hypothetical protein
LEIRLKCARGIAAEMPCAQSKESFRNFAEIRAR